MKQTATVLWMLGLTLLILLIVYHGIADVMAAVAVAGWGLLIISMYSLLILIADTLGWRQLIPTSLRPSFTTLLWTRWICGSINSLLPVIQVGGDVVRARLIVLRGVPGSIAGASVIVDITIAVITQILFSLVGIFILFQLENLGNVAIYSVIGVFLLALLIAGFYFAQRAGLFLKLAHILEGLIPIESWKTIVGGVKALDQAVDATYRRRMDFLAGCVWRLLGWGMGIGEVWLALYFLGHPVSISEALILESLGQAIRSSGFIIPGAYGIQEGGLMVLGAIVGLDEETGLALSLVKRVRELLVGLPALAVWNFVGQERKLK